MCVGRFVSNPQSLELAAACALGSAVDVDSEPALRSLIFSHFRVSIVSARGLWVVFVLVLGIIGKESCLVVPVNS